jgi:hypothetical protein
MSTLLFVGAFCVVALFVYMARYSGRLRVAHTRIIDAPVGEVYARVSDLARWREWNPWLEHEPDVQTQLSVASDVEGSRCTWNGTRAGSGKIEHRRLLAPRRIEQQMRFQHPFRFRGRGTWEFSDRQGKTEVIWSLRGRVAFPMRAFAQTVQGTIALDFRYGLDRLARLVEGAGASRYSIAYLGVREVAAMRYACITHQGRLDGLADAMPMGFASLRRSLDAQGVPICGEPMAVYVKTNIKRRTTVCRLGIPVGDAEVGALSVHELPAHCAYVARVQGSAAGLEIAWYQAMQRMRIENIEPDLRLTPFERYFTGLDLGRESDNVTELHMPVRRPSQSRLPVPAHPEGFR